MGLYDVVRERQKRRTNPLWLVLLVLSLIALLLMGLYISKPQREHDRFIDCMSALSKSTSVSFHGKLGRLLARVDGQELSITEKNGYELYQKLFYMTPLHFGGSAPQEEGVYLKYADGATLELWAYPLKEGEGIRSEGVFVRFTTAEGRQYSYYTDRDTLTSAIKCLSPESNPAWEPYAWEKTG